MTQARDYLARLGAKVVREGDGCRILREQHSAIFPRILESELRRKFDEGMDNVVAYYSGNLRKAGVQMEAHHVEEVAFAVVLATLAMYNRWRRDYEQHRDQPLVIGPHELDNPASHDECWRYCKREFGERYREYAAAMTGMSVKAFEKYEKRRTEFLNSW